MSFNYFQPIFYRIGFPSVTLKKIFNPRGIIFNKKIAKNCKWRRRK